jgi:hypothetical protein
MTAYIGANNRGDIATTFTPNWTEPTGFEVENAFDYKTVTALKLTGSGQHLLDIDLGSSFRCNYYAVAGHTLGTDAATMAISWASSSGGPYTLLTTITPTDNKVKFKTFSATTARYWRIEFNSGTASTTVGHISFGENLTLQPINKGFRPPIYEHYSGKSRIGSAANYMGRQVRRVAQRLQIQQTAIEPATFRTDFVPALEFITENPFFFSWDYENYPDEAAFCWIDSKAPEPVYSHLCYMAVDISCYAITE